MTRGRQIFRRGLGSSPTQRTAGAGPSDQAIDLRAPRRARRRTALSAAFGLMLALVVAVSGWVGDGIPSVHADSGLCAIPGADGPGGTLTGIVNTYYPGTSLAPSGATSISLGSPSGAATPITAGDLLLLIQMQDAAFNSTNTGAYGDGVAGDPARGATDLNNVGRYEYVVATGPVAAGSVPIVGSGTGDGTLYMYTNAATSGAQGQRRFQVIRVPQYSSAALSSGLTALPWDGTVGGVLALDVAGELTLGGTVDLNGLGFRGGGGRQRGGSGGLADTDYRTLTSQNPNGSKGEGIAGTPQLVYDEGTNSVVDTGVEGYPNGSMARGAPGNAGGGGTDGRPSANDQNTGGGGGGNGGIGGMGGHAWSSVEPYGGFGGAAFVGQPERLVLGGGGGAATRNNTPADPPASSGGGGGGMALVRAGSVAGTGSISVNGSTGLTPLNDGGGGGGAGGSVLFLADSGGLAGLSVSAVGGDGGDAWPTQGPGGFPGARHGPGGGGGGGVILLSATAAAVDVGGGSNGTSTTALDPYGATPGAAGTVRTNVVPAELSSGSAGATCLPDLTTSKTTSTPQISNSPSGTTAAYTIEVSNAAGLGTAINLEISDSLPSGFTYASTTSVVLSDGASRPSSSNPTVGDGSPTWGTFSIPGGGSVAISFVVDVASTVPDGTYQNPAQAAYSDPQRTSTSQTTSASYDPGSSSGEDVTIGQPNIVDPKVDSLLNDADGNGVASPGDTLEYVMTISNTGGIDALGVTFTDSPDANTTFVVGSVTTSQGSVTNGNALGDSSVAVSIGTIPPSTTVTISFQVTIDSPLPPTVSQVENQGLVSGSNFSPSPTDDPATTPTDDPTATPITIPLSASTGLPATGFAPGRISTVPEAPAAHSYAALGDMHLTIPKISTRVRVVGVGADWDVTWLGSEVGYLPGTAYPTWRGNSVVTGHVYLADGSPGPLHRLHEMAWGDEIVVEAYGARHVYQVREVKTVRPHDLAPLAHEERDWITLITCRGWDEAGDAYRWRLVVRAVLSRVESVHAK